MVVCFVYQSVNSATICEPISEGACFIPLNSQYTLLEPEFSVHVNCHCSIIVVPDITTS